MVVPHRNGLDFGVGFEAGSQQLRQSAVIGEATGPLHGGGVSAQKFDVSRVSSSHELATKLKIDVQASYGAGAFGAGVSGRFGYMEESKVQASSVFMAVTCSLMLQDLSIDAAALSPEAAALVNQPALFRERYGDMFVRGCERGGLFVGVIQIDTSDSKKSQDISAQLKGTYGFFSAEASTSFSSVASGSDVRIYCSMYSEGGPAFDTRQPNDPQALLEYANIWFKALHDDPEHNAKPMKWYLSPLTIASGPAPANAADILHAQDVLVFCARERLTLLDQMNLMDHMAQNPGDYDFVAPTTHDAVVTAFKGYQSDLELISDAASMAMNDVAKAAMPAAVAAQTGRAYPLGIPPAPMPMMAKGISNALAEQGRAYCREDELLTALRLSVADGPARLGFDVGVAVMRQLRMGPGCAATEGPAGWPRADWVRPCRGLLHVAQSKSLARSNRRRHRSSGRNSASRPERADTRSGTAGIRHRERSVWGQETGRCGQHPDGPRFGQDPVVDHSRR